MKLSNKELELKLRDLGYRPHINHFRVVKQDVVQSLNEIRKGHKQEWIVAKGGITYCKLIDDSGVVVATTTAICSPKDNYNKKIGIHIAMARALAAVENGIQLGLSNMENMAWVGAEIHLDENGKKELNIEHPLQV